MKQFVNNEIKYRLLIKEIKDLYKQYKTKNYHTEAYITDKIDLKLEKMKLKQIAEITEKDEILKLFAEEIQKQSKIIMEFEIKMKHDINLIVAKQLKIISRGNKPLKNIANTKPKSRVVIS